MIDQYLTLLAYVCAHPRYIEELIEEECSFVRAGNMSVHDWRRTLRMPSVRTYMLSPSGDVPIITRQRIQPTLHHPANQAIMWMNDKVLVQATEKQKMTCRRIITQAGWTSIRKAPLSNSALLFFVNDPHYAALYQCGRAILKDHAERKTHQI